MSGNLSEISRKGITRTNVLRMPRKVDSDGPQTPEPTPISAGVRPSVRLMEAKAPLVMRQLDETEDARVVARRHGVKVSDVVRTVIREIRSMKRAA